MINGALIFLVNLIRTRSHPLLPLNQQFICLFCSPDRKNGGLFATQLLQKQKMPYPVLSYDGVRKILLVLLSPPLTRAATRR
jgi:hypothetical protein